MKPVDFPGRNVVMGEGQPQYARLPARRRPDGVVVSCWRPNFWERLGFLLGGRLWLHQHTFNQPMQPVFLTLDDRVELPGAG